MKLRWSPFTGQNRLTSLIWQGHKQRRTIPEGAWFVCNKLFSVPAGEQKPRRAWSDWNVVSYQWCQWLAPTAWFAKPHQHKDCFSNPFSCRGGFSRGCLPARLAPAHAARSAAEPAAAAEHWGGRETLIKLTCASTTPSARAGAHSTHWMHSRLMLNSLSISVLSPLLLAYIL